MLYMDRVPSEFLIRPYESPLRHLLVFYSVSGFKNRGDLNERVSPATADPGMNGLPRS
jgi:hypothetical protein